MDYDSVTYNTKALIELVVTKGEFSGNGKALALLDAERIDSYIGELEDQVEETEYLIYNAEDWIDNMVDKKVTEFERVLTSFADITEQDKGRLIDVMEDLAAELKEGLSKKAMSKLGALNKVYCI